MMVSVVIPAFNAEQYLSEAVDSVLLQEMNSVEILIVNDGSTDGTSFLITEYEKQYPGIVRGLEHPGRINQGVSRSRLLGLQEAQGEFIALLDADDSFLPGKMEKQLQVFREHPEVIMCHTAAKVQNENVSGLKAYTARKKDFAPFEENRQYQLLDQPYRLQYCPICNSSVLVRCESMRSAFRAIPQAYQCEDWLTSCLLAQAGSFYYIDEPLVTYRIHADSFTENHSRDQLKQTFGEIEFYASLSVLAVQEELRFEAEQRLVEKINLLRFLYAQGGAINELEESKSLLSEGWHARLIWERDVYQKRLNKMNQHFSVRLLRRVGILPKWERP